MGTSYRFLAIGDDMQHVLDWFANLPEPPNMVTGRGCQFLHFHTLGRLVDTDAGKVDPKRSPIASLFPPENRRGVLWTAAELHFLPTPLATLFPKLNAVNRRFSNWLGTFDRVFERPGKVGEWDYCLEGSLKNWDTSIYALPNAMAALRDGQYFVSHCDDGFFLDKLCQLLRLRGIAALDGP